MKKTAIIFSSIVILLALFVSGIIIYTINSQPLVGISDITASVNVMLNRRGSWKKIIEEPVISKKEMYIIDGSTATIPITAEILRQFFGYNDSQVDGDPAVRHSTTHNAYVNLISGTGKSFGKPVKIIFVTPPSDEETQYAQTKNVELDITPVAKDGFVFITNKDNPVDSLTVEQIQDIYTGKITNWKQVGGKDSPIKPFQREANSGSQTAMEQIVMKGKEMLPPESVNVVNGMGPLIEAVAEYDNGPASIGYTYYYYLKNLYKNDKIKVLKVDGTDPSNKNLISGEYPFSTSYFAVIRAGEPEGTPARKLRNFLLTQEGQSLIEMAGYCKAVN